MARYRRIVHYSKASRRRGHPGGVEKFAMYLAGCIGMDVLTPEDAPHLDDPSTLYIVDNHWGLEIPERCRVICVLQGCAAHRGFNRPIGRLQAKMARRGNTRFIANSLQTQLLCREIYGVDSEVIRLAVDERLFHPRIEHTGTRVLTTTAGKKHKGAKVIPKVQSRLPPSIRIEDLRCGLNEEADAFRSADGFVLLSTHEGFAYSLLEAMCADLPVVTGPHGIAFELDGVPGVTVLSEDDLWKPAVVADALLAALGRPANTRQWVLDQCSLALFERRWREVVAEELDAPPPEPTPT